jgi:hypothetical protein
LFTSLFEKKRWNIFMPIHEYMILGEKSEESMVLKASPWRRFSVQALDHRLEKMAALGA